MLSCATNINHQLRRYAIDRPFNLPRVLNHQYWPGIMLEIARYTQITRLMPTVKRCHGLKLDSSYLIALLFRVFQRETRNFL